MAPSHECIARRTRSQHTPEGGDATPLSASRRGRSSGIKAFRAGGASGFRACASKRPSKLGRGGGAAVEEEAEGGREGRRGGGKEKSVLSPEDLPVARRTRSKSKSVPAVAESAGIATRTRSKLGLGKESTFFESGVDGARTGGDGGGERGEEREEEDGYGEVRLKRKRFSGIKLDEGCDNVLASKEGNRVTKRAQSRYTSESEQKQNWQHLKLRNLGHQYNTDVDSSEVFGSESDDSSSSCSYCKSDEARTGGDGDEGEGCGEEGEEDGFGEVQLKRKSFSRINVLVSEATGNEGGTSVAASRGGIGVAERTPSHYTSEARQQQTKQPELGTLSLPYNRDVDSSYLSESESDASSSSCSDGESDEARMGGHGGEGCGEEREGEGEDGFDEVPLKSKRFSGINVLVLDDSGDEGGRGVVVSREGIGVVKRTQSHYASEGKQQQQQQQELGNLSHPYSIDVDSSDSSQSESNSSSTSCSDGENDEARMGGGGEEGCRVKREEDGLGEVRLKRRRFSGIDVLIPDARDEGDTSAVASREGIGMAKRTRSHYSSEAKQQWQELGTLSHPYGIDVDSSDCSGLE